MLSERDIELAHPEAFDFAFGNLPAARRADFNHHLGGCPHCQRVVDEYSDIGLVIKNLPPHVEPPADLQERTVAAMVAALAEGQAEPARGSAEDQDAEDQDAEDQDATRAFWIPRRPSAAPETRPYPRPVKPPAPIRPSASAGSSALSEAPAPAEPLAPPGHSGSAEPSAPAEAQARPIVTHLSTWRRPRVRLAVVLAAAAVILAAVIVPLSIGGSGATTVVIPLHATAAAKANGYGAATGRATARLDPSGSWDITLTVAHLKSLGDRRWYQCWYVNQGRQQVASAGTFQVPRSGRGTFSMTSAVDPRDFRTMKITVGPPSNNGALQGIVVLTGQTA